MVEVFVSAGSEKVLELWMKRVVSQNRNKSFLFFFNFSMKTFTLKCFEFFRNIYM